MKLLILALSVNSEIFLTHFLKTYKEIESKISKYQNLNLTSRVYSQGFEVGKFLYNYPSLEVIRDDSVYHKNLSISEIRDYFTYKVLSELDQKGESPDYILHCDDDFKFNYKSMESIIANLEFMESNPDVGLVSMYYSKSPEFSKEEFYDLNPSRVATRSGILIRTCAFKGWGSEYKVRYFEECVLAERIYEQGYRVIHSHSDIIHKTKPTGLGLSQERKYGKNNIPYNGRKILCDLGMFVPSVGKTEDGSTYSRYDVPLRLSSKLEELHTFNHNRLLNSNSE